MYARQPRACLSGWLDQGKQLAGPVQYDECQQGKRQSLPAWQLVAEQQNGRESSQ